MTSHVVFPASSLSARLDIYLTSSLGLARTFLTSYYGSERGHVDAVNICIPAGVYYILFVPYMDAEAQIGLGPVTFTEQPCSTSTATDEGSQLGERTLQVQCCTQINLLVEGCLGIFFPIFNDKGVLMHSFCCTIGKRMS